VIDDGIISLARDNRARFIAGNLSKLTGRFAMPGGMRLHMLVVAMLLAAFPFAWLYALTLHAGGVSDPPAALFAVLAGSMVSSIGGFAFSAICGALLVHLMSGPVHIVQVMMICSIAIQSLSVAALWRNIDWVMLPVFLAGGILGLPIGVAILTHLGQFGFQRAIGVLILIYAVYMLFRRPVTLRSRGPILDACAGFFGGITGGLAAFPGAAVTVWCSMKGWDKARQRGVYQPFILTMQILALLAIHLMSRNVPWSNDVDLATLAFVPLALLGTWLGLLIFRQLSERQFDRTVNLLLVVSGAGLLA
jgi:uncharacterized membrane protein YfcA